MQEIKETIRVTLQEKVKEKDTAEPTVINDDLIRDYMVKYKEEAKIYDKRETPFEQYTHLSLSFLNIIEINNLQCLERLEKLQLDNNIIHKIEKLDHLVNLKWLDLSFNLISKIENLDTLTKLEDLSLFSNNIEEVENLDKLVNLNVLSIGNNKIETADTMAMYLRRFAKLQVLNVKGNKFCKDNGNDYKLLILAYLKNIRYLDYSAVDKNMLIRAEDRYRDDINDKEAKAAEAKGEEPVDPMSKEEREQFRAAHITTVIDFFKIINENDEDMQKLARLPKHQEIFQKYDEEVRDRTKTFTDEMLKQNDKRMGLMKFCEKKLNQIERESEGGSIQIIDKFKSDKKKALRELDEEEYNEEVYMMIKEKLAVLEDDLLGKEMKLVEMLSEATAEFKQSLDQITDDMRKLTEAFVEDVLRTNEQYHEQLEKYCKVLQIEVSKEMENQDDAVIEENQETAWKLWLLEQDLVSQCLETTKDSQHSKVSDKETEITQALGAEKDKYLKKIGEKQHIRNRDTVTEIIGLVKEMSDAIEREMNERMSEDNYD